MPSAGLKSESSPKARGIDLKPEYLNVEGVEHEFNGTLFVPTASELERLDRLTAIKDGVKQVVAGVSFNEPPKVQRAVPYCHGFSNVDGPAPRVKMSARDLIRLGATKSKGR